MKLRHLAATAALALLALPATAAAGGMTGATLTAPVNGATLTTSRPTMTWENPGTDETKVVETSQSATTDVDGFFTGAGWTDTAVTTSSRSWAFGASDVGLYQGLWYWHVQTNAMGVPATVAWSPMFHFTVPAHSGVNSLVVRTSHRGVKGTTTIHGNGTSARVRVFVTIGKKRYCKHLTATTLLSGKDSNGRYRELDIDKPLKFSYHCYPGFRVAKGTKIRVQIKTSSGKATASRTKTKRV